MSKLTIVVLAVALNCARGHVAFWNTQNHLHPVHGLYVKPSEDGSTGDLYVAASEDNGVKTQWLTDQHVNFLPVAAAQQSLPFSYTSSYQTTSLPHDETVVTTQKRAVITSPPMKYAYAIPGASGDGKAFPYPYPYTIPVASVPTTPVEGSTECANDAPAPVNYAQYSAYQYYYPQMIAAFANAINALKDAGVSEDTANKAATPAAPIWPYAYPVQYVMVDPAAWAQAQTQPTSVASQSTSSNNSAASSSESV